MARLVRTMELTDAEKGIVRRLLLQRIRIKALRNFRHICRLIPMLAEQNFWDDVAALATSADGSIRHRASLALSYFPQ